jgi:hypothetical protein
MRRRRKRRRRIRRRRSSGRSQIGKINARETASKERKELSVTVYKYVCE